jgi:hypothetical protein
MPVVDATSGLNLFPLARLCNNSEPEWNASMTTMINLINKLPALQCGHLLLSLHLTPENNYNRSQVCFLSCTESIAHFLWTHPHRRLTILVYHWRCWKPRPLLSTSRCICDTFTRHQLSRLRECLRGWSSQT